MAFWSEGVLVIPVCFACYLCVTRSPLTQSWQVWMEENGWGGWPKMR